MYYIKDFISRTVLSSYHKTEKSDNKLSIYNIDGEIFNKTNDEDILYKFSEKYKKIQF